MKRFITATLAAALLATAPAALAQSAEDAIAASIALAIEQANRPETDVARDGERHPSVIAHFAGVRPGMTIAEIAPGGGYYTRVISAIVGPEGKVYALVPAFFANRPGGLDNINALAAELGNVEVVVVPGFDAMSLPQPVDLVWTTENYHDLANGNIAGANAAAFNALEPGGIYFVEDHSAPGTGTSATSTLHRIDPMAVIAQVTAAGFVLEAVSDAVANPADPHTVNPREVEPTSDKFALRFRRPN